MGSKKHMVGRSSSLFNIRYIYIRRKLVQKECTGKDNILKHNEVRVPSKGTYVQALLPLHPAYKAGSRGLDVIFNVRKQPRTG